MNLWIIGKNKKGLPKVQNVKVIGFRGKRFLLDQKVDVEPFNPAHWDAVRESVGKKSIPMRSVSSCWSRGNVFESRCDAIKRIKNIYKKKERRAEEIMEEVAMAMLEVDAITAQNPTN